VREGDNITGCVKVELLYDSECDAATFAAELAAANQNNANNGNGTAAAAAATTAGTTNASNAATGGATSEAAAAPLDCKDLCVYSDHQRTVGYNGTSESQRGGAVHVERS
jgi:hypothetical protein